ncbi:MAG: hypothetical protein Q4G33_11375 [bacterium]|nr:hypothetical protein [bacterium]
MNSEPDRRTRLNKCTKSEIIDGLCHQIRAEYIIDELLTYIDEKRIKDLFEAEEAAAKVEAEARREYSEWLEQMMMKYGGEKRVSIADLTLEELRLGKLLEDKIAKVSTKLQNINRKLEKMLGL